MSWRNGVRPRTAPPSRRHGRRRPTIHEFFSRDGRTKKRGWSAFADHDGEKSLKLAATGLALALLGAGAAGCGFKPLLATDGGARGEIARVHIEQIEDRTGQQLRNALLLSFPPGDPEAPAAWRLKVTLNESKTRLGVVKQDVATRANLTLTARYALEDTAEGKTATAGEVRSVNSYNILESPYGTLAAERNARTRGVRQLADGLTARLAAWLYRRQ